MVSILDRILHENVKFYFKVIYPIQGHHHPTNIFCFWAITYVSFWELIIAYPNGGQWTPFS